MSRWQFARELFDEHFRPLREAGYELERAASHQHYREVHDRELGSHFPAEVFFDLGALRTEAEREGQKRLAEARGGEPLSDFTIVRQGGAVVAVFSGAQQTDALYRMWHSNVHRDHRRKGIYRMIVDGTIRYTQALGFDSITSEHAPCNNAILVAKLRAGFYIYSLETDPCVGPSVVLRYFHNPEHRAAFELRCGMATLTPGLRAQGTGAWERFREQVTGEAKE